MAESALGNLIRDAREAKGLTQAELGAIVGTTGPYISQIESGQRRWPKKYIAAIGRELEIPEVDLLRAAGRMRTSRIYPPTATGTAEAHAPTILITRTIGTGSARGTLSIAAKFDRLSPEAQELVIDLVDGLIKLNEIPTDEDDRAAENQARYRP